MHNHSSITAHDCPSLNHRYTYCPLLIKAAFNHDLHHQHCLAAVSIVQASAGGHSWNVTSFILLLGAISLIHSHLTIIAIQAQSNGQLS